MRGSMVWHLGALDSCHPHYYCCCGNHGGWSVVVPCLSQRVASGCLQKPEFVISLFVVQQGHLSACQVVGNTLAW